MPYSDPKHPVVNPSPDVDTCLKATRFSDIVFTAAATSGSWAYGYVFGKPVRAATANTAAALGFTFAGMIILQNTRGRLMGYKKNEREVSIYGLHPVQPELRGLYDPENMTPDERRFPIALGSASPSVRPKPRFDTYN